VHVSDHSRALCLEGHPDASEPGDPARRETVKFVVILVRQVFDPAIHDSIFREPVRAVDVEHGIVVQLHLIGAKAGGGEVAVEIVEKATDPVAIEATGAAVSGGMAFGIFVFGLILAFVAGAFVAKAMKMTDWGFRFGVCFAALAIGVMPFLVRALNGESIGDGIRLGIDLAGGTNMLFRVKGDDEKPVTNEVMDKMVGAVGKRIDPSGTSEITVRQVGADRLEVIVPGEDPQTVNEIKKRIT